jgi:chloramphenicol-sensitive protein RarD
MLTINWGVYIWSVSVDRIVESSLGYYMTPLVNVAFGVLFLHERLHRFQKIAVGSAAVGVLILTIQYGALPWIAFVLAISWGSYTIFKKKLNIGALEGLSVETTIALIPNLIFLGWLENQHKAQFGHSVSLSLLLASAGIVTVVPLLLFNGATTRLPLVTTGLLQYITPTIMFIVGIAVNHESMPAWRVVGFAFIWIALIFLGSDLVKSGSTNKASVEEGQAVPDP